MRRLAAFLIAAGLLRAAGPAEGLNAIRASDLRADVTFLASDALEGRLSLRRGSEAAIQFIAAEFTKAGLKPASGGSFLQTVPLIEYRIDPGGMRLALERDGSRKVFHYPTDFWGGYPDETQVRAPVVFAGYGITAPEFGYDDYAGLDARGKIVLIFDHEPQENDPQSIFNGLGNTRHANSLVKIWNAERHGAVGVLLAAEPNRRHPSAEDRRARIPGSEQRAVRLLPQALSGQTHIPLFGITDALLAELLAPTGKKAADLQSSIDAALRPASTAIPQTTIEMRVSLAERRRGDSANVIGMLEGRDPRLKSETIIFSAHYDHDGEWDGQIRPGADDNASGTAGVIALARAFARNPERPRRTLLFAVFAAEERGLLGSYYYASHPLRPLDTTRAVINFDMIGRNETPSKQTDGLIEIPADTSNTLDLIGTNNSPDYRAAVERANREIGLRLDYRWDKDAALNIFQRSDQYPFVLHDIPAVWWFTGFHPDYHQTTDSADKLNYEKMARILKLAYFAGLDFADTDKPPAYVPNRTQP